MTGKCQGQLFPGDTLPVIENPAKLDTALLQINFDARSTGIQTVFEQLLKHGRRPLDYFSGRNLINELGRKLGYGHARILTEARSIFRQTCGSDIHGRYAQHLTNTNIVVAQPVLGANARDADVIGSSNFTQRIAPPNNMPSLRMLLARELRNARAVRGLA